MNTKTAVPKIPMIPVESSQIAEIGHDPDRNILAIRFRNKSGPAGLYHYPGVSPDLHHEFMGAESKGVFFGSKIKNAKDEDGNPLFPHSLINEEEKAEQ